MGRAGTHPKYQEHHELYERNREGILRKAKIRRQEDARLRQDAQGKDYLDVGEVIRKGILWVRRLVTRGRKRSNRTGQRSAFLSAVWANDPHRIARAGRGHTDSGRR